MIITKTYKLSSSRIYFTIFLTNILKVSLLPLVSVFDIFNISVAKLTLNLTYFMLFYNKTRLPKYFITKTSDVLITIELNNELVSNKF